MPQRRALDCFHEAGRKKPIERSSHPLHAMSLALAMLVLPGYNVARPLPICTSLRIATGRSPTHVLMAGNRDEIAKAKAVLSSPVLAAVSEAEKMAFLRGEGISEASIKAALQGEDMFAEVLSEAKQSAALAPPSPPLPAPSPSPAAPKASVSDVDKARAVLFSPALTFATVEQKTDLLKAEGISQAAIDEALEEKSSAPPSVVAATPPAPKPSPAPDYRERPAPPPPSPAPVSTPAPSPKGASDRAIGPLEMLIGGAALVAESLASRASSSRPSLPSDAKAPGRAAKPSSSPSSSPSSPPPPPPPSPPPPMPDEGSASIAELTACFEISKMNPVDAFEYLTDPEVRAGLRKSGVPEADIESALAIIRKRLIEDDLSARRKADDRNQQLEAEAPSGAEPDRVKQPSPSEAFDGFWKQARGEARQASAEASAKTVGATDLTASFAAKVAEEKAAAKAEGTADGIVEAADTPAKSTSATVVEQARAEPEWKNSYGVRMLDSLLKKVKESQAAMEEKAEAEAKAPKPPAAPPAKRERQRVPTAAEKSRAAEQMVAAELYKMTAPEALAYLESSAPRDAGVSAAQLANSLAVVRVAAARETATVDAEQRAAAALSTMTAVEALAYLESSAPRDEGVSEGVIARCLAAVRVAAASEEAKGATAATNTVETPAAAAKEVEAPVAPEPEKEVGAKQQQQDEEKEEGAEETPTVVAKPAMSPETAKMQVEAESLVEKAKAIRAAFEARVAKERAEKGLPPL